MTVLKKLAKQATLEKQNSFIYDLHALHVFWDGELFYGTMADQYVPRSSAFRLLESIQREWHDQYGELGKSARAYQMNADFASTMKRIMDSEEKIQQQPDKVAQVQEELERTKQVMSVNIDRVLERGEKIDLLVEKSENMATTAVTFHRKAKEVRQNMCWQNKRTWVVVIIITLVIAYIALASYCGTLDVSKC